ncbi:STM3941 family protein [Pseudoalteromonas luteoviolacea]|uniref:Uncharacterized protein n=1 Tax=Pseudoalteromonas luteoviolacea (strain 2ta16) TaxID=1353533 RepID=V4H8C2_PSEL2|nr:STM3941 family protein [Pseudoalteromonas luteoviolacea]ESP93731.1 hypothetical protein PL2TA16_02935 [Pseudoalteromonas luteoviolacea 2ta16]KZN41154.1 hypothetical protein N483_16210 [Pseudoalteromonas luteoviolacea NCIMB 1944]
MENTIHFKVSSWKFVIAILGLCIFEYMCLSVLSTPFSELDSRTDRLHTIFAYLFFAPVSVFIGAFILTLLAFLLKPVKGLTISETGITDTSSPFSIGEIPFDNISSINSRTNITYGNKYGKARMNEVCINIRRRKIDNTWWANKGLLGRIVKRLHTYTIPTKVFSASHNEIVDAIEKSIINKNIKFTSMDFKHER